MSNKELNEFLDWVDQTNEALMGAGYVVVHVPPTDLMPYEHVSLNTDMSDKVDAAIGLIRHLESQALEKDEDPDAVALPMTAHLTYDQLDMLQTALMVYKSVLMTVHKDKVKQGIQDVLQAIGRAQQEGKFDFKDDQLANL